MNPHDFDLRFNRYIEMGQASDPITMQLMRLLVEEHEESRSRRKLAPVQSEEAIPAQSGKGRKILW